MSMTVLIQARETSGHIEAEREAFSALRADSKKEKGAYGQKDRGRGLVMQSC